MTAINYKRLADALEFYQGCGYRYIEAPWFVPRWAIKTTCPHPESVPDILPDQVFVGSSEQSFVYLDAKGLLGKGKFVACTPCFRPGDEDGALHQQLFMKIELYQNDLVSLIARDRLLGDAARFMTGHCGKNVLRSEDVESFDSPPGLKTTATRDILLNDIEVGSYGLRGYGSLAWVFGTGLAEPRFSAALDYYENIHPLVHDLSFANRNHTNQNT